MQMVTNRTIGTAANPQGTPVHIPLPAAGMMYATSGHTYDCALQEVRHSPATRKV